MLTETCISILYSHGQLGDGPPVAAFNFSLWHGSEMSFLNFSFILLPQVSYISKNRLFIL
jgi:hypothetical protein